MDTHEGQEGASGAVPSVRESLAAAMQEVQASSHPADTSVDNVAAASEADPSPADKARDDKGRFAPKATEAAAAPKAPDTPAPDDKPAAPASDNGPPASWNAQARDLYSKADPALQAYIRQREQEQLRGVEKLKAEYEPKARFADEMWSQIAPFADLIRAEGGTPAAAVRDLLQTAALFRRGTPDQKAQALYQIARQFNVPLPGSAPAPSQAAPIPDAITRELYEVKSTLTELQQARQVEQTNALKAQIEQFKVGKPHFDAVAPTMGKLIEAGIAQGLEDAYERAIRLDPEIFGKLQAEQAAKEKAEREAAAKATAEKAKKAGVSVNGAPGLAGSGATKQAPAPNLRDEISRAFATVGRA